MPKESDNKITNINVNVNNSSKKTKKRQDVLDLSAMVKEKEASKEERRPKKLKKKKKSAPVRKVKSIPNNVSLGLVNKEKKFIYVTGVTFFMALICVLWAFNLDKLYSAENSKSAAPLFDMNDLVDFDAHLNERMSEVKAGLEKLSEEDDLFLEEYEDVSQNKRGDSIISNYSQDKPDEIEDINEAEQAKRTEQTEEIPSSGEFKAIDLKKIIEDIRNMSEEDQIEEILEE